jgi:RNA polymerase sigma factor (sigma-70 family)
MTKVAGGDNEALRVIYIATSPKLYGYAFRILHKHELAEDVLQETFIAVWRNASYYQSNLSAPITWMTTILRNKAFDLLRTIDYLIEIDADNFDEDFIGSLIDRSAMPLEILESNRLAHALTTCMEQLDSTHRQVVRMAFFDDMSHSEIAIRLNLPIGTVKTWIRRSLGRLKNHLIELENTRPVLQKLP